MHVSKGKHRGINSSGRSGKGQQAVTEQFPELRDDSEAAAAAPPPPYYAGSGESSRRALGTAPVFTIGDDDDDTAGPDVVTYSAGRGAPRVPRASRAPRASKTSRAAQAPDDGERYYLPASFPGYTVVQLINQGGANEGHALLPRVGGRRLPPRGRSCCGRLCACLCFVFGALTLAALLCAGLMFARQMMGPSDWRCQNLLPHSDRHFTFGGPALRVESVEGITQTNVHFVNSAGVRAVIEASPGRMVDVEHSENVLRLRGNRAGPWWWQQGGCVRATLYVGAPPGNTTLKSLSIATGDGTLSAEGVEMGADTINVSLRNGGVGLRDLSVVGSLHISTTNGRIKATRVGAATTLDLWATNSPVDAANVTASQAITVQASNSHISVGALRAAHATLRTTNGRVTLHDVLVDDNLLIQTSNAAIEGGAGAAFVYARTSNARVGLRLEGRLRTVAVDATNGAIDVMARGFWGTFDVRTSNSRARVEGVMPVTFWESSTARKMGVYGDPMMGNITLTTSNARAALELV
ncbi:hypothetical protein H4S07_000005 [Coemansia furcata]|uniref:Uncharacterized protein n=1 Tax=Coemansia furcata TaxID=417177 RepID=A0ACC1LT78_9FUNG|nr:hypothetical protein H4S07_000005 [Coemansia furcata]